MVVTTVLIQLHADTHLGNIGITSHDAVACGIGCHPSQRAMLSALVDMRVTGGADEAVHRLLPDALP